MHEGTWTIDACDYADVKALSEALELGEITASILVRRGHSDIDAARAFVVGEIEPHDPFLLGDMAVAVDRIRTAIAEGKRICVHGDYDVDGISQPGRLGPVGKRRVELGLGVAARAERVADDLHPEEDHAGEETERRDRDRREDRHLRERVLRHPGAHEPDRQNDHDHRDHELPVH